MLSHHAYYIEDSLSQFSAYEAKLRASEKFEANNPNFVAQNYEKFGIDEARALIQLTSFKNTEDRALFFIGAASMTSEAQQALLKLLEEPQWGTTFVLLIPHGTLLPTLKSRCMSLPDQLQGAKASGDAAQFLSWGYKQRSDWVATLLKDEDNARERVRTFLNELEIELHTHIDEGKDIRDGLDEIGHFRQYLSDRAPSLKMILEHFAATLPSIK
jgi:hypothetical protein